MDRLALTPEEAAFCLGVSRWTIYSLIRKGELEGFTIGTARRISVAALRRYVARLDGAADLQVGIDELVRQGRRAG